MGTGSGVNAVLAASHASDVVAVDINPDAVRCARHNAELNGVAGRVKTFESDVFERVEGKFDLIIFDPSFRWFAPRDMYERSTTDEGYILVFFGTSGDIDYLMHLIQAAGFARRELRNECPLRPRVVVSSRSENGLAASSPGDDALSVDDVRVWGLWSDGCAPYVASSSTAPSS